MPVILLIGLGLIYQLFFRYESDVRDPDGPGPMAAVTYEKDTLTGSIHRLKDGEKRNILQRLLGTGGEAVDSIPGDPAVTLGNEEGQILSDNRPLSQSDIPPESQELPITATPRRIEPDGQLSLSASSGLPSAGSRQSSGSLRLQPLDSADNTDWELPPENTGGSRVYLQGRVSEATEHRAKKVETGSDAPVPEIRIRRQRVVAAPHKAETTVNRSIEPHLSKKTTRSIVAPSGVNSGRLAFHDQPDDLNADGRREEIIETPTGDGDWVDISVVSAGKEVFNAKGKRLLVLPRRHHGWSDLAISTTGGDSTTLYRYNPKTGSYSPSGLPPLPGGG